MLVVDVELWVGLMLLLGVLIGGLDALENLEDHKATHVLVRKQIFSITELSCGHLMLEECLSGPYLVIVS